jgi:DNA-directed RNA polymerase III subunit RPC6
VLTIFVRVAGLDAIENMVLQCIDSHKNQGIWSKAMSHRLNIKTAPLEKIIKTLEQKGRIKQMRSVAHPQRKMYILSELTPSEDATGGSWFTEGKLDQDMIRVITSIIELYVSRKSWRLLSSDEQEEEARLGQKRKRMDDEELHDPFQIRAKALRLSDGRRNHILSKSQKMYKTQPLGYQNYPTLRDITSQVNTSGIVSNPLPELAIAQLLQVMIYQDKLFRITRLIRANEVPDNFDTKEINMYRSFKNPELLREENKRDQQAFPAQPENANSRAQVKALRQIELEDIGDGGSTEIPCLRCPVFDICGDGGEVNARTCVYFKEWHVRTKEADLEEKKGKERETDFTTKKTQERDKASMKVDKGKGKEWEVPQPILVNSDDGSGSDVGMEELEPS